MLKISLKVTLQLFLLLICSHVTAQLDFLRSSSHVGASRFMTAEQAFSVTAELDSAAEIIINVSTAPQTYLYQHAFKFYVDNSAVILSPAIFPPGEQKSDPDLGNYVALKGNFTIKIPYTAKSTARVLLTVDYQGCSEEGICYPPQQQSFELELPQHAVQVVASNDAVQQQNIATDSKAYQLLRNNNKAFIIAGFLILGILLSLTPCVLPIVPILSRIIIGQSNTSLKQAFKLSFSYVQGMSLAYALAGVLLASFGENITAQLQRPSVIIVMSIVFLILGVSMFGVFNLQLPTSFEHKIDHIRRKQKTGSMLGAFIMGFVSSLIVSPCISAPLAGTLLYIVHTGDVLLGGMALYVLGIGMGLPLMLFGTSLGKIIPQAGAWMNSIKNFLGILMIAVAIYLLSRIISASITLALWGALLLICSSYLGLLDKSETGWEHLMRGVALLVALYGVLLIVGATLHGEDLWHPLQNAFSSEERPQSRFNLVETNQQLSQYLRENEQSNQIIILDFYANWCISCKEMEKDVFNAPQVTAKLQDVELLKVDLTSYSVEDQAIMQRFKVFNPPTVIFFAKGQEIPYTRITAVATRQEFINKLTQAQQWRTQNKDAK